MLHASADALAEILGISPSPSSSTPGTPYAASSLPSTMPPSKAASPAPTAAATVTVLEVAALPDSDESAQKAKAIRKAEKKAAKEAAKTASALNVEAVTEGPDVKSKKKRKRTE